MIESCDLTDTGCVRVDNQDRILIDHGLGIFVVADGMGGHRHGEMAAELALSTMKYYLESSRDHSDVTWPFGYDFKLSIDANRLVTSIRLANRHVFIRSEEAPEYAGMGTTIAAVLIQGDNAVIGNVGDSRIYLFRNGELKQLTIDDTWIAAILEGDVLNQQQWLNHRMRGILTQSAGSKDDVDVHCAEQRMESDDLLLLSSDGLHGIISGDEIQSILALDEPVDKLASRLMEAARKQGAPDNVSCALLSYKD